MGVCDVGHKSQLEESWSIIRDKPDRGSERKRALETSLNFNFPFKEMGFVASVPPGNTKEGDTILVCGLFCFNVGKVTQKMCFRNSHSIFASPFSSSKVSQMVGH